jgi:hypothetical protein
MLQLNPPIWLETPIGIGLAHLVDSPSLEHSLYWVVFDEKTGRIWRWENEKVRAAKNITLGRNAPEIPERTQT